MKKLIWSIAFLPLLYLGYKLSWFLEPTAQMSSVMSDYLSFLGGRPQDPLKLMADTLGLSAIWFLMATLLVSPLRVYLSISLIRYRRLLGLWAFAYALMHAIVFFVLDNDASFKLMFEDIMKRPFVLLGMVALSILFMMALTSFKFLYSKFLRWHKLVYLAVVFICLHYIMSQKVVGLETFIYVSLLLFLLVLRLIKR